MATLRTILQLEIEGTGLQTERITPDQFSLTVGGDSLRSTVTLTTDFSELYVGEITPRRWFLYNAGSVDVVVSMGAEDDITLAPGEPALVPSTRLLLAKTSTGTGQLMYAVMES